MVNTVLGRTDAKVGNFQVFSPKIYFGGYLARRFTPGLFMPYMRLIWNQIIHS